MTIDPLWAELESLEARDRDRPSGAGFVGNCPACGRYDYLVHVGRDHWAICTVHRTRWHVGRNLFTVPEDYGDWNLVSDLHSFREVKPCEG